jgi:hypothetical protein
MSLIPLKTKRRVLTIMVIICVFFIVFTMFSSGFKPIIPDEEFAFGPTPQNGQPGNIEGVYYYRSSSQLRILGCKADGWTDCTSYHLLKFYADGTVFTVSIATDDGIHASDLPNLETWFGRDNEELSYGQYFISRNRIWFSITTYYDGNMYSNPDTHNNEDWHVTVDYSGIILGDHTMILNSYSHLNGFSRSNAFYNIVE